MIAEFLLSGMRKPWLTSIYILIIVFSGTVLPYMFSALKFYVFQGGNTHIFLLIAFFKKSH